MIDMNFTLQQMGEQQNRKAAAKQEAVAKVIADSMLDAACTPAHDIGKAIVKTEIEWNSAKSKWTVTITRLDRSSTTWDETFFQDASDKVHRMMETEDNWP